MIFLTGDTHGVLNAAKLSIANFPEQKGLSKSDYLIICGDFGGLWYGDSRDEELLNLYEARSFTTLFVDGNHENYNELGKYPTELWHGGKVQRIREHVLHLMRGQVYTIDGRTFFTMGGASSAEIWLPKGCKRPDGDYVSDISEAYMKYRARGIPVWDDENISKYDLEEGFSNLEAWGYRVDYVLSHGIYAKAQDTLERKFPEWRRRFDINSEKLDQIREKLEYQYWFSGHIHVDIDLPEERLRILFNDVIKLN